MLLVVLIWELGVGLFYKNLWEFFHALFNQWHWHTWTLYHSIVQSHQYHWVIKKILNKKGEDNLGWDTKSWTLGHPKSYMIKNVTLICNFPKKFCWYSPHDSVPIDAKSQNVKAYLSIFVTITFLTFIPINK